MQDVVRDGGRTDGKDGEEGGWEGTTSSSLTRHRAVFDAIEEALLQPQLVGGATRCDVVSLIAFHEAAYIEFLHLPFGEALQRCRRVQKHRKPKGPGCYVPALGALRQVLSEPFPGKLGAVNVLFFSDGRPSDSPPKAREVRMNFQPTVVQVCAAVHPPLKLSNTRSRRRRVACPLLVASACCLSHAARCLLPLLLAACCLLPPLPAAR